MTIEHFINLSTTEPNNDVGIIKIRQSDEQTQTLVVQITENGVPKDFTGYQPFFCAKIGQALGLGVIEQAVSVSTPAEGKLSYTFKEADWQELGRQTGYFAFRNAQGRQFSTRDFNYTVTPSVFSEGLQEVKKDGSTYIQTFEDMLRLFNEYVAQGKTDWTAFVEQNRAILESVDPGGVILTELIDARENADGQAFSNLSARLNGMDATSAALQDGLSDAVLELADMQDTIETSEKKMVNGLKEGFDALHTANGKGRLKLPLYYNDVDHQATHPSVLFFEDGYLGYKFWMGYTPYTNGNELLENPCVAVSEDGFVWKVFDGMVNPLAKTEDVTTNHYSDTHLVKNGNTLECWYRHSYRGNVPQEIEHICRRTTTNGKDWTPEEVLFTRYNSLDQTLCPVVHCVNGVYKIWVVNYPSSCLDYFETSTGANWQLIRQIPMPTHNEGFKVWHMDIVETNGFYELYYDGGNNRHLTTSMCYATSTNNQLYTFEAEIFKSMPENFDEKDVYRPSVFDVGNDRWMFYGGQSYYGHWGIGVTIGKKDNPTVFKGIELSTRASYFKGEYTGHVFPSGIHTPSVRLGVSELNEKEIKFTTKGVSDIVFGLSPHFDDLLQVQNTFNRKMYTGILMHRLHLWDAPNETPKYYLSVENGKLRFFDGNYHQFVSVPLYADASERPVNPVNGDMIFAKELGKPIWYHGGRWVDATGATV